GSGAFDLICVVQHDTQVTYPAHTGFGTHGGLTGLDTRITERTLLGLAALPVVIDFLVWTTRNTHPPAPAFILVNQYDAVFLSLVDRPRRTACHTGGIQAVFTQPGQIHHEGIFEGRIHFPLYTFKQGIFA